MGMLRDSFRRIPPKGAAIRGSIFNLAPVALAVPHVYVCTLCCLLLLCDLLARCTSWTCCLWVEVTGPRLLHHSRFCLLVAGCAHQRTPPVPCLGWHAKLNAHATGCASHRRHLHTGKCSPSLAHLFTLQARIQCCNVNRWFARGMNCACSVNRRFAWGTNSCLQCSEG